MSRVKVVATMLMLSCVGVAGIQAFGRQAPTPLQNAETQRARTPRVKYMTKEVATISGLAGQLNDADVNGWEFVQAVTTVVPSAGGMGAGPRSSYTLIFRRPADRQE